MARRERIDPETTRLVEQRLQWLLTENGPEAPSTTRAEVDPARTARGDADPSVAANAEADSGPSQARVRPRRSRAPGRRPDEPVAGRTAALPLALGSFRRAHLVVVGVIVALGILLAGWAVLRARPVAVAVTPPPVTATPAGSAGQSGGRDTPSPGATTSSLVVHVLGAVRQPGLVTLSEGSRVQDALEAAGGLTAKADPGELNLAQQVADGQQIVVGIKGKPSGEVRDGAGGSGGHSGGAGADSGAAGSGTGGIGQAVNLNTATQAQLEDLPGVGPVMAGKIIAWRTEHGRFSRVEELQEIDGVGPKTYAKLAPLCRV